MNSKPDARPELVNAEGWRAHNVSQLLYFRSLTLREKLEAVEGMADVVRLLERMRGRSVTERPRS